MSMSEKKTKLKPCPFCGEEVNIEWFDSEHQNTKVLDQDEPDEPKHLYIACHECDYELSFDTVFGTARELREAWNRRIEHVTEIPAPHGRLIDADVIMDLLEKSVPEKNRGHQFYAFRHMLRNAPTVIEAEE